ncbi:MAG TPA: NUDIX domain-containing protein [Candidatus Babeliales bacterium]|nr:NUDIX domain-containing protein [Candidatus Babeliales bacterium]
MIADELLDIVDEQDRVIAQASRSSVNILQGRNFRAINAFIENDQGQLWIPRRTAHKATYPLALDSSIGGCVSAGETYEDAFEREAQEEVNININQVSYTCAGYFTPSNHGLSAFMKVFKIHSNETPSYNDDDFCDSYWLTPREIIERINAGEPAKSDLPKLIRLLFQDSFK